MTDILDAHDVIGRGINRIAALSAGLMAIAMEKAKDSDTMTQQDYQTVASLADMIEEEAEATIGMHVAIGRMLHRSGGPG